ncbi:hypothetical protein ACJJTC_004885 [Scirpophaga incertulas]
MSGLQRTPTKTRLSSSDNAEATVSIPAVSRSGLSMQHCDSAPDLTTLTASIADRKKRKYEGDDINIADVIEEMFSRFSMEQEKRFRKLQDTVSVINSQNADLQKSVELLSNKYDDFLTKISMLESGRQEDRKTIRQLEEKLESLEPSIGQTIGVNIDSCNIRDVYRLNSQDTAKSVVVELSTVLLKDKIMKAVKTFNKNKNKTEKLNTSHISNLNKIQKQPIFISETLMSNSHRLFHLARNLQKSQGFMFCWTSNGIVYLRKNEGSSQIRVNSESDLEKAVKSN